jgi:Secretion system C-terminal sorting domain
MKSLQKDDYSQDTVLSDLNVIASQCPFEGGPAVYLARNLISTIDTSRIYDDASICSSSRKGNINTTDDPKQTVITKVYPNPFKEGFVVDLIGLNDEIINIVINIHDIAGRLIRSEIIKSNNFPYEVNLTDRKTGIYFLELLNAMSNVIISNDKIIQLE